MDPFRDPAMAYDNVGKYLIARFQEQFSQVLLGKVVSFTEIQPSELSLDPIRADSVIFLRADNLILHLEFQTDPKPDIPFRMADYCLRLHRRYPDERIQIRQIVLYLRRSSSPLVQQTTYERGSQCHGFEVIRIWEQDPEEWMSFPGLLPFAVLTRPDRAEEQLRQVASKIEEIGDPRVKGDITAATAVLAGLALDKEMVRIILGEMTMRESPIYQEWRQEALAEGRQEGIQIGEQRGIQLGEQRGIQLGKQEGIQLGKQEGIQLGKQEGIQLGKLEAVPVLAELGLSAEEIAQRLDLPPERVSEILGL